MRLPRDLSGTDLAQALRALGYRVTRQTGSHLRLTTSEHGEHHITIPQHKPIRVGIAEHFELSRDEVVARLFGAKTS